MTAAIFRRAGYFVADDETSDLQPADAFNPSGYWESRALLDANREILHSVGFNFDNTWMFESISNESVDAIAHLRPRPEHVALVRHYEANAPWVWKDPRLCFTLAYWWPLMDPERTSVLLLTRDPEQIIRSFKRVGWREDLSPDIFRACIEQHVRTARRAISELHIPHVKLDYFDFYAKSKQTAARINEHFGTSLTASSLGYVARHNSSSASGRLRVAAERVADVVPDRLRKAIKSRAPRQLLAWFGRK